MTGWLIEPAVAEFLRPPAEGIDLQLARELCNVGRVVFQEHDAVLDRLLPPAST